MPRPSGAEAARQIGLAALTVAALVLIGALARTLYIVVVRPSSEWVRPKHRSTLGLAISVGIAAGALQAFLLYSGVRRLHCEKLK